MDKESPMQLQTEIPSTNHLSRSIGCVLITLMLLLATTSVIAQNDVVTRAKKAGVKRCLPAINALSGFIIGQEKHGSHDVWQNGNANKGVFSSTIERDAKQGSSLTSLTVAPVQNGKCSTVYDQVQWFDRPCLEVAKKHFPNFSYQGLLAKRVMLLQGPATLYLQPAGDGCLSLKKQIIMDTDAVIKKMRNR